MAKTWDDFLPLLRPHLFGCPDMTTKLTLGEVASEFFTRTYLWRDTIDSIFIAPNQFEYDLDADALVENVISVVYEGQELTRTDDRLIPHTEIGQRGVPSIYWVHADNTIRVHPVPDLRARLRVTAVLKPNRAGTGVEDWIYETWADALVDGTIAKLTAIPGKDWSDPGVSAMRRAMYEKAIINARIRDFRGVELKVRQRPFA